MKKFKVITILSVFAFIVGCTVGNMWANTVETTSKTETKGEEDDE